MLKPMGFRRLLLLNKKEANTKASLALKLLVTVLVTTPYGKI
jgi:hypothetical protein